MKTAILAGGCYWGMEALLRRIPGVLDTQVGFTGGHVENPSYEQVCTKTTGHAEAIKITYDPEQVSYRRLLELFFQIHDPTTVNRQGNDIGDSYRSEIFYTDDDQRLVAEQTIRDVDASGIWPGKVVTKLTPAAPFWDAPESHQDYLDKNPNGYTCHFPRPDWVLPNS